jgi:hypothetical protein
MTQGVDFFLGVSEYIDDIAAYLLKAKTVEPEKQPLLENGSETALVSRQRPRNRQWKDVRC